ncbi:MAG: prepilin-type N-terminal cleavage/methylation domain-containing protein, partial [Endomicrobium sp.]|nr:prepilin-type N-terminal cleavage/methylation domain-containing protein [Endomicrobium sp.]
MRQDKGFTLFEVLISMALTGILVCSIGTMLVFGYRQLGRIIHLNKDSSEIMIFRSHIESRIQKITGRGFLLGDMVDNLDVRFIEWREYNPVPPILPNGLPNFNAANPVRVSNWTNLVGQRVVFNSVDPTSGEVIRCIYEYFPERREVEYREFTVPLDANGQESPLTLTDPTTALRLKAVILQKIIVFQIGRSSQGLIDWELYPTRAKSQAMTNPIMDAYIRIFVRTENDDVRY